jgi:hypothetical protein
MSTSDSDEDAGSPSMPLMLVVDQSATDRELTEEVVAELGDFTGKRSPTRLPSRRRSGTHCARPRRY